MNVLRVTELWQRAGVYAVRTEVMVKGFGIPLNKEFDAHDTPDTLYLLALDGILPVAACRLFTVDAETAKIERVSVLEGYRGKGVGRALITQAEAWLRELGFRKAIITSRDAAVGFYEKLGYQSDWGIVEDAGIFNVVHTEKAL